MSKRRPKVVIPAPEPVVSKLVSSIVKRSIVIDGRKTSISLEDPFWNTFKHIAKSQEKLLGELVHEINESRSENGQANLSSALRLHVLDWALTQADLLEVTTEMAHG